jgi:hypothetical protein
VFVGPRNRLLQLFLHVVVLAGCLCD